MFPLPVRRKHGFLPPQEPETVTRGTFNKTHEVPAETGTDGSAAPAPEAWVPAAAGTRNWMGRRGRVAARYAYSGTVSVTVSSWPTVSRPSPNGMKAPIATTTRIVPKNIVAEPV